MSPSILIGAFGDLVASGQVVATGETRARRFRLTLGLFWPRRRRWPIGRLGERLNRYVQNTLGYQEEVAALALEVLRRGELPRGDAARATGRSERSARGMLGALVEAGLLVSDTPKGPVRLRFSVASADVLFPRLFGAQAGAPSGT